MGQNIILSLSLSLSTIAIGHHAQTQHSCTLVETQAWGQSVVQLHVDWSTTDMICTWALLFRQWLEWQPMAEVPQIYKSQPFATTYTVPYYTILYLHCSFDLLYQPVFLATTSFFPEYVYVYYVCCFGKHHYILWVLGTHLQALLVTVCTPQLPVSARVLNPLPTTSSPPLAIVLTCSC